VEATANGKITFKEPAEGNDIQTLCTSYAISSNTLTITGGDKWEGSYTQITP
jgi:hypothetical protein